MTILVRLEIKRVLLLIFITLNVKYLLIKKKEEEYSSQDLKYLFVKSFSIIIHDCYRNMGLSKISQTTKMSLLAVVTWHQVLLIIYMKL